MVQANLDPNYALAKDISDLKARLARLELMDIRVDGLADVVLTSPVNKQALVYDQSARKWINGDNSWGNLDNGFPNSTFGGVSPIDCGGVT